MGETGPAVPISSDSMQLFSLSFDDEVVSHIVTETDTYAQQCLANTSTMWHTMASEIKAYHRISDPNGHKSTACRRSETTAQKMTSCIMIPLHHRSLAIGLRSANGSHQLDSYLSA